MKQPTIAIAVASAFLIFGVGASCHAQELVQSLSVNLTAFDGTKVIKIGTSRLIKYFVGTNVPNGRLQLVTPSGGNPPGTIGNLNAFLRIKSGSTIIYEIHSPDQFNLYQDAAALVGHSPISAHAL